MLSPILKSEPFFRASEKQPGIAGAFDFALEYYTINFTIKKVFYEKFFRKKTLVSSFLLDNPNTEWQNYFDS